MNDLSNASKLFTILFADDTTLQYSSENLKSLHDFENVGLSKIVDWFKANKTDIKCL